MYNKYEASLLKQQFWTSFGQYMAPVPSADGSKVNWVNYKTGVKDLHFTMQANNTEATISISLVQTDVETQTILYNRFLQLKNVLEDALQEEWQWKLHMPDNQQKTVSNIFTSLGGVSIYKQADWPAIISFFKPRIIALDGFWTDVKFGFE